MDIHKLKANLAKKPLGKSYPVFDPARYEKTTEEIGRKINDKFQCSKDNQSYGASDIIKPLNFHK